MGASQPVVSQPSLLLVLGSRRTILRSQDDPSAPDEAHEGVPCFHLDLGA